MSDYLLHFVISLSMIASSGLIIGSFALLRRRHSEAAFIFALYCYAIAWWAFWQIFMMVPTDLWRAHIAGKISQIGVAFIATLFFHFCISFLKSQRRSDRVLVRMGYAVSIVVLLLIPTPYFTGDTVPKFGGKIYFLIAGPVDLMYIVYFFCIVIYALLRLFQAHARLLGYQKEQVKWVIVGTFVAYIGGGANYFLSFGIDPYPWIPFGNYGVAANFVCFGYAIFRYRFLDVDEAVEQIRASRLAGLGALAAGINHEIKNPLYVIKGTAESFLSNWREGLYQKEDPKKVVATAVEVFEQVFHQSERIHGMISDILDFVRPSSSGLSEEMNLTEAIDRALSVVGYQVKLNQIEIRKKISPNLPPIHANRSQIEEILFNLMVNACQAMKRGGTLTIEAGPGRVQISDTGPGISPEIRDRLFEPLSTSREDGTGLGLYITRQLVERNGGDIGFDTSAKGTSFYIEFKGCNSNSK